MEEDLVAICQALFQAIGVGEWKDMHGKLKEVSMHVGAKKAGQIVADLGTLSHRKEEDQHFFLYQTKLREFEKRSDIRESLNFERWTFQMLHASYIVGQWRRQDVPAFSEL